MELHELHVAEPAPGFKPEGHALAVVLVPTGGAPAPDPGMSPGAENDGISEERGSLTGVEVEGECSKAGSVGHQQA
jgi:hypothetical protein